MFPPNKVEHHFGIKSRWQEPRRKRRRPEAHIMREQRGEMQPPTADWREPDSFMGDKRSAQQVQLSKKANIGRSNLHTIIQCSNS